MNKTKIHSFIVLAHKDSPYLEECIFSLENQSVKSEIFIATSTHSIFLECIAKKYKIPLLINRNSDGIASDWSFAYNHCKTEYLTLVHQDDVYLPEYTQSCLKVANAANGIEHLIIFTGYNELIAEKIRDSSFHLFIKDILLLPFLCKQKISSVFLKRFILFFGNPIPCPTVMYHKTAIGQFEFSKDFQCNMDWDAWIRLAQKKGVFVYVKSKLVNHRIHKDTQTFLQIQENVRQKEDRVIFERLWTRPMAIFLASIYSLATKFNETQ